MQDEEAANTLPGDGEGSVLNEETVSELHDFAHSKHIPLEDAESLQQILVVEDDTALANLEAEILTAQGYKVTIADTGELAISALHQFIPDLVLLDLELSGTLSGWDVLQALRTYAEIPVLLTSAERAVRQRIRTRGESRLTLDHLPKPYPMQILLKRIKRMLMMTP